MYKEVVFDLPAGTLGGTCENQSLPSLRVTLKSPSEKHLRQICHAPWTEHHEETYELSP